MAYLQVIFASNKYSSSSIIKIVRPPFTTRHVMASKAG